MAEQLKKIVRPGSAATLCGIWSGSALFAYTPLGVSRKKWVNIWFCAILNINCKIYGNIIPNPNGLKIQTVSDNPATKIGPFQELGELGRKAFIFRELEGNLLILRELGSTIRIWFSDLFFFLFFGFPGLPQNLLYTYMYIRMSIARTPLEPWKDVPAWGSSS